MPFSLVLQRQGGEWCAVSHVPRWVEAHRIPHDGRVRPPTRQWDHDLFRLGRRVSTEPKAQVPQERPCRGGRQCRKPDMIEDYTAALSAARGCTVRSERVLLEGTVPDIHPIAAGVQWHVAG